MNVKDDDEGNIRIKHSQVEMAFVSWKTFPSLKRRITFTL